MKMRMFALAAALAATLAAPVQAADTPAANGTPTAKQLAALCADCGIVTAGKTVKRKGKASGVGAVGGAVAGGVVGNKMGDSTGATVGGAVVGGLLGNEIEKHAKSHKVWIITVTQKNGSKRDFEMNADPGFKVGDVVVIEGDHLRRK